MRTHGVDRARVAGSWPGIAVEGTRTEIPRNPIACGSFTPVETAEEWPNVIGVFDRRISSEAELREIIPDPLPRAWAKEISYLDEHCRAFIVRSPFLVMASSGTRVTPRGGPPGFVRALGERHLAFADYTGNRRADSHRDILRDPKVQLEFFVPGVGETLRVGGEACLTTDPELLATLATGGDRPPRLAVGVTVEYAFVHCAKALLRAGLWDPERWPDLTEVPSGAQMLRDHVADGRTLEKVQADLDESYATRLW